MEAKDTVIQDIKININTPDWMQNLAKGELNLCVTPLLESQAAISFKAGYKQRQLEELPYYQEERQIGRQEGIREVVEWLQDNFKDVPAYSKVEGSNIKIPEPPAKYILGDKWQSKLKDWGINED